MMDYVSQIDASNETFSEGLDALDALAREAIYYGAESFYLHQCEQFSRHRYRHDGDWFLGNVGISIRPMLDIARFVIDRTNLQITESIYLHREKEPEDQEVLTNSLLVSKNDLVEKFGEKAKAFISKFATPIINANLKYTNPFTINQVSIAPLIDLGNFLYVPHQYRLFETIYESPFYWLMDDRHYRDTAAEHRGTFLEKTAARLFCSVFGAEHVFENVTIHRNRRKIAGEADILVVYGEFVIVVQAKSKRITLKARAGDLDALKADFEGAIQAPYYQAYEFAELIQAGAECQAKDGKVLTFHGTVRIFPAVILSDGFPSATLLSWRMLERSERIAPVIWDIGALDCVTKILSTPIYLLYYLKCRSDVFEYVHSDSEYNFIGYHLRSNLVLPADADWMLIDRDFATIVDDFMIACDMKLKREPPVGNLERIEIPVVSDLLRNLRNAPPQLASVVIYLYDFSSAMLEDLSRQIVLLRKGGGRRQGAQGLVNSHRKWRSILFSLPVSQRQSKIGRRGNRSQAQI